jgi:methionyl-tRNA formyltransferase
VRVAYLGTSDFAATVLRRVMDSEHDVALVVTPPDARRGRGRRELPPPVAELAAGAQLPLLQSADVNEEESLAAIRAARPDVVAVCAFGQLIREPLLSEYELVNVHPSLLPRWRGAAPIERAIMARDARTGVCIMRLTAGLDSGPVALRAEVEIGSEDDFEALSGALAPLGGTLLVEALDLAARGALEFNDQDEAAATYAEKIEAPERRLDPAAPAPDLAARVRGLTPHVGAYLQLAGEERLGVRRAVAVEDGPAAGEFAVAEEDGSLLLGCGAGALRLDLVQPPGGKPMPADAYLRGHALPALS